MPLSYYEALAFVRQFHLSGSETTLAALVMVLGYMLTISPEMRPNRWTKIMATTVVFMLAKRTLQEEMHLMEASETRYSMILPFVLYTVMLLMVWADNICHCGAIIFEKLIDSTPQR